MESSHPVFLSCYPVNFKLHAVIMTHNLLYVSAPSNISFLILRDCSQRRWVKQVPSSMGLPEKIYVICCGKDLSNMSNLIGRH